MTAIDVFLGSPNVVEVSGGSTKVDVYTTRSVDVQKTGYKVVDFYGAGLVAAPYLNQNNPLYNKDVPGIATGLVVTAFLSHTQISWVPSNLDNHAHTEIWRSETDDRATAYLAQAAKGSAASDPATPSTTYYYWIRHVSMWGTPGPWNGTPGTVATTGGAGTIAGMLAALQSTIDESSLTAALLTRLGQLEANGSAIAQETTDRGSAITLEVADRNNAIAAQLVLEATARTAEITLAITQEVNDRVASVQVQSTVTDGLSAQFTVKVNADGNVAGFGLASSPAQADGTTSEFTVVADKFSILHPNATDPTSPELVFTVANGVTSLDAAYITNLTAEMITVTELSAFTANIGTVTAGKLQSADGLFVIDLDNKSMYIQ